MEKIIIILILIISSILKTFANDYNITNNDKLIINKLSYKIQNILDNSSLSSREVLIKKINQIQQQYKNSKKLYTIFEQIKINTHIKSNKQEYINHYKKYNINYDKIKSDWLNWHNYERTKLWRSKYSYDERLNQTAFEWSKKQNELWEMSHKRNPWDWFYNYKKIENWFNKRWIKCKISWWATSSESIAKYWYYCNDNDCTEELSKSLKEIFNIYMSEKWLKWIQSAHYKWIILPSLNKIWLWLFINENFSDTYWNYKSYDYYVTTHYCTNFKK